MATEFTEGCSLKSFIEDYGGKKLKPGKAVEIIY